MNGTDALFLHGGPGMRTVLERNWWQDRLPIEWWEQPAIAGSSTTPYGDLVDAVGQKLLARAEAAGGPVPVIAHSFGCVLALEMAHRHPRHISGLHLLAAVPGPRQCFLRLAERILPDLPDPSPWQSAMAAAEAEPGPETFWALVGLIMSHPGFMDYYWGPDAARQRDFTNQLAATEALVDPAVFQAVTNDFLDHTPPQGAAPFQGPVRIFMGRHDPLLAPEADFPLWQTSFPAATLQLVDTGHFIHLESESGWWPAG